MLCMRPPRFIHLTTAAPWLHGAREGAHTQARVERAGVAGLRVQVLAAALQLPGVAEVGHQGLSQARGGEEVIALVAVVIPTQATGLPSVDRGKLRGEERQPLHFAQWKEFLRGGEIAKRRRVSPGLQNRSTHSWAPSLLQEGPGHQHTAHCLNSGPKEAHTQEHRPVEPAFSVGQREAPAGFCWRALI